ncbi:MAG: hypothetical protein JXQ90_14185 [Cyclobacteriaceae bacterium]
MRTNQLEEKIRAYKKKHALNSLIKGVFLLGSILFLLFLIFTVVEYSFRLGTTGRTVIFYLLLSVMIYGFFEFIGKHLAAIFGWRQSMTDDKAALDIGNYFPDIKDKLLNTLQLQRSDGSEHQLIRASIDQRIVTLSPFSFASAIDLRKNKSFLIYFSLILVVVLIVPFFSPGIYSETTSRIVNHRTEFVPQAPFRFVFNDNLNTAFKGEDVKLDVLLEGSAIPAQAHIVINGRRAPLTKKSATHFYYEVPNIQSALAFHFEAGGYSSPLINMNVVARPEMRAFNIRLAYPSYTGLEPTTLNNTGNLNFPEGTRVQWMFSTYEAEAANIILFSDSTVLNSDVTDNQVFKINSRLDESTDYEVELINSFSKNADKMRYHIEVDKDDYPEIDASFFPDTILYEYLIVSGNIQDDYGFNNLQLMYEVNNEKSFIPIAFNPKSSSQSYYHMAELDSIMRLTDDEISFQVYAWDNDEVNGSKISKSSFFTLKKKSAESIRKTLNDQARLAEDKLEESLEESRSLNEMMKSLEERLKSKSEMAWQEEKILEDILEKRKQLDEAVNDILDKIDELNKGENKFNDRSEELKEKSAQLQKLMNDVLDEETKKLYEELQKLLEEKGNSEEIKNQLDRLKPNQENLEKELERALELFKRIKLENDIENLSKDLEELSQKQNKLSQETLKKQNDLSELKEQQEQIEKEFEEHQERLDNIEEQNQELEDPEPLQDMNQEEQAVDSTLEQIQKDLDKGDRKSGSQQQKQAGEQMKKMSQKLQQMQESMQMEVMQENIDDLENILDDLVKLSHNEEAIINEFKTVRQIDPRFVELSQEQLKLNDDAKVIEDSLMALASREFQISSFVTRELSEMNRNIDLAVDHLKDRNRNKALSNQQFAMTSINNLALLLSDLLQQMQMAMAAQASGKPSKGKGKQDLPSLQQLQQQLSQQIQQLKKGDKKGRQLSEELARMAAEQEMLRQKVQEMQEKLKGQHGNKEASDNLSKAIQEMEQNEIDLVNKRITQELINRQERITTRLLEAEKSMKEQRLDEERKGESATYQGKQLPKAFEEYLEEREKEIELLKTVPLDLNPFYKKEVNDYFRRLSNDN